MAFDSLDPALAEWLREIVWIKIDLIFENSTVFARLVIKTTFPRLGFGARGPNSRFKQTRSLLQMNYCH